MIYTNQEIRTDLSSAGRGNRDIDFYKGQKKSPLEDTASHMHQQYRLKQGMKNQRGLKSNKHQGKLGMFGRPCQPHKNEQRSPLRLHLQGHLFFMLIRCSWPS